MEKEKPELGAIPHNNNSENEDLLLYIEKSVTSSKITISDRVSVEH